MSNRIIHSGILLKRNPLVAFLLSIIITGLGQLYNGELSKGITFFFLRIISLLIIPAFLVLYDRESYIFIFVTVVIFHIVTWLTAAIEALFSALRGNNFSFKVYNSISVYFIYGFISSIILAVAIMNVSLFFEINRINSDRMSPTLLMGEFLLINRYVTENTKAGDLITYDDNGESRYGRIIAGQNDSFIYKNGLFEVNRVDLSIGVFTDKELICMGLDDLEDVFFENNGNRKYPIKYIPDRGLYKKSRYSLFQLNERERLIALDNRSGEGVYEIIDKQYIRGRVEGIIVSNKIKRIMLLPYIER